MRVFPSRYLNKVEGLKSSGMPARVALQLTLLNIATLWNEKETQMKERFKDKRIFKNMIKMSPE